MIIWIFLDVAWLWFACGCELVFFIGLIDGWNILD